VKKERDNNYQYVIVMVGESLDVKTKKQLQSGCHRVRRISSEEGKRYSVVHKMRSRPEITGARYEQDYVVIEMQRKALKELN